MSDEPVACEHTDFDDVFAGDGRYRDEDGRILTTRIVCLGDVPLERLAVGDPLAGGMGEVRPAHPLPGRAGEVEIVVLRYPNDDERIAVARVVLSAEPVARWEEADTVVGVDTGTAAVGDARAVGVLDDADTGDALEAALADTYRHTWSAVRFDAGEVPICAFSSGIGDGAYPVFWGLDADGRPAALAVDFELLVVPETEDVVVPRPEARGRIALPTLEARGFSASSPRWRPLPWQAPRWIDVWPRAAGSSYVYARYRLPGDDMLHWLEHRSEGGGFRLDLRDLPDEAELVLRIATGHRPMRRQR